MRARVLNFFAQERKRNRKDRKDETNFVGLK
jgi:hypothetical protein